MKEIASATAMKCFKDCRIKPKGEITKNQFKMWSGLSLDISADERKIRKEFHKKVPAKKKAKEAKVLKRAQLLSKILGDKKMIDNFMVRRTSVLII